MKLNTLLHPADNSDGFVLVTSMVILLILVVLGTTASRTTTIEFQIAANDRFIKQDFYNQETCKTTGLFKYRDWLTTTYLAANENAAFYPPVATTANDADGNGVNDVAECMQGTKVVGSFKIRNIERTQTDISAWVNNTADPTADQANNFPKLDHKDKPDPGSGFDPKNFTIRRYVITSYSPGSRQKVVLQEGVNKIFNAY